MSFGSVYFNGTTSYLQLAGSSQFAIATYNTPFTIECWLYPIRGDATFFSETYTGSGDTIAITLGFCDGTNADSAGRYLVLANYNGGSWIHTVSSTEVSLNTWTHIAAVYTGITTKIFINGVDRTKTSNPTPITMWGMIGDNGDNWVIGRRWDTGARAYYQGYISNFRFVVGTAVYDADFTVPTTDLSSTANTKLLTCESPGDIIDRSSNNFAITIFGGAQATMAHPFRSNWLGEGLPVTEDFNPITNTESKQNWSHTQIGFRYR